MTGRREILKKEAEYERQLSLHNATSSIYFLLSNNLNEISFKIQAIYTHVESINEIIASKPIDGKTSYSIKIIIFPDNLQDLPEDTMLKIEKSVSDGLLQGFHDIILVGMSDFDPIKAHVPDNAEEKLVYWKLADDVGVSKYSGIHSDSDLESFFGENGTIKLTNVFPVPYAKELHPLIKFAFLSLNYSRIGKFNLNSVIDYTSEYAYRTSVGIHREEIKDDFLSLIRILERIGLITVKGNSIYFPKNRERFEKTFHRKYWDFLERSKKTTLFDFERHF